MPPDSPRIGEHPSDFSLDPPLNVNQTVEALGLVEQLLRVLVLEPVLTKVKVMCSKFECRKDIHYKTQTGTSCGKCNSKAFRPGIEPAFSGYT